MKKAKIHPAWKTAPFDLKSWAGGEKGLKRYLAYMKKIQIKAMEPLPRYGIKNGKFVKINENA